MAGVHGRVDPANQFAPPKAGLADPIVWLVPGRGLTPPTTGGRAPLGAVTATIIQNIQPKFGHRPLYFKWSEQKSSSCLAWVIHRKCAIELLNLYLPTNNIYQAATPDCWTSGIYQRVDKATQYNTYTYKYPMFIYPDNNDSQLENSLDLHKACKRQLKEYLEINKNNDIL